MAGDNVPSRIVALTRGRDVPSSRFRVRQYIDTLSGSGIDVEEFCPPLPIHPKMPGFLGRMRRRYLLPVAAGQLAVNLAGRLPGIAASHRADAVWISRGFLPGFESGVRMLGRPRVLDVDDAVWLSDPLGPRSAAQLARRVDRVIAGNEFLAEWYGHYCRDVVIAPTAVDCLRYVPADKRSDRPITIGWIGTSGNFGQLDLARGVIDAILREEPHAMFLLVADKAPDWWPVSSSQHVFRPWSVAAELSDLQSMDIGIMPLADTDWNRGKCSFKMLQYMAVGLPVVASPVGMNTEVLGRGEVGFAAGSTGDWADALRQLVADEHLRGLMGAAARKVVLESYDIPVVVQTLANALRY